MSSVVISGNTSGTITLDAPAVAGTTTLTLPATSGTFLTTTSPKAGNVIQVVNAIATSTAFSSTNTFVDTGLTASITPSSASSKILVIANVNGIGNDGSGVGTSLNLVRNSTTIVNITNGTGYNNPSGSTGSSAVTNYLDSPATTSATTYKVQFCSTFNNARVNVQGNAGGTGTPTSTITLMEIAQ